MIAIPAIDLKDGKVVRLFQGKFDAESVYAEAPETIAKRYESEGAERIHVVDLDGALEGKPRNLAIIERILRAVKTPVEVGGGIRDVERAKKYLEMGARWVILGTQACLDEGFLKEAVSELGARVIIGVDAREGHVAVEAWTKVLPLQALEMVKRVEAFGGETVIYTDIAKDGALSGPNLKQAKRVCESVSLSVIASGGVGSLKDLEALHALKKENLLGVIIGKALYEKKFSLKEAIGACSPNA